MGILDKGIDIASFIGSTIFDPGGSSRGYKASKKLIDSGELYLNELKDQIAESTAFWIRHKKILGDDFTEYEIKEALLSREMSQEKENLKDTKFEFDPVAYKEKLMDSGEFERTYNIYMDKYKKAEKYRLPSGLAYKIDDPEHVEKAIAKYTGNTKKALNKLAREVYNSYGIDKDLFALLGFGRDRDLSPVEIGDYSFLMQEGDSPTKRALITQLTKEIEAGLNSYGKMDTEELASAMGRLQVDYMPSLKKVSTATLAKYRNDPNTRSTILGIMKATGGKTKYPSWFEGITYEDNEGKERPVTDILEGLKNTPEDPSLDYFQMDLQDTAAIMKNIFNDPDLVPKGGALNDSEIIRMAFYYLIKMDNLKPSGQYNWGLFGEKTTVVYTKMTSQQKHDLFNNLPDYFNILTQQTGQFSSEKENILTENIAKALSAYKREEREIDPYHPINIATHIVNNQGNPDALTFESIEARTNYITKLSKHYLNLGYAEADVNEAASMIETIPLSDITSVDTIQQQIAKESRAESPYARKRREARLLAIKKREEARLLDIKKREEARLLDIKKREERRARQNIKSGGTVSLLDRDK